MSSLGHGINFMGGYPPPPETPPCSPFREFIVQCLHCHTHELKFYADYSEDTGETSVWMVCPRCQKRERIPI